ncbi:MULTISPECIES: alpha/beta fold hydrolase [Nostocales]|nr:alpha/beta hydrolase [Tolypothrix bouteillei]
MESRILNFQNGKFSINFLQGGSGTPLLYLHSASGLQTGEYLNLLSQNFQVYAPWHPGFGPSTGEEHLSDTVDLALYYQDLMDELEIESACVVGHSFGGMLAAEIAALCPNRVKKLVLVSPLGLFREDLPVLDFFSVSPDKLVNALWHDPSSKVFQHARATATSETPQVDLEAQKQRSFATAKKFLVPFSNWGLKHRINHIQAPTLIVWGESDGLVPSDYARDFCSQIQQAQVTLLPNCGHLPMFEQQDSFISTVTEFLQKA